ncbi:unnamed protein product [Rotaria socialis]
MASSSVVILSICAVILLLCNCVSNVEIDRADVICSSELFSGNTKKCVGEIINRIWKMHQWSTDIPINVCDVSCMSNIKGRFSKFEWLWDVRFRCDSKAPGIIGYGTAHSRQAATQDAIQVFINRATVTSYAKAQDFQC